MKLLLVAALALAPSLARAEAPAIKVVSTGKAPAKPIRLEWKKGAKATVELVQEEWISRNPTGEMSKPEPKPTIRTTIDLDVTEVRAKGDVKLDVVYRKIEADKGAKPDLAKKMNAMLGPLAGSKGHSVISSRGVVLETELKPPAGTSAELAKQLEAMRALGAQIVSSYPEEAVGIGAKWETSTSIRTPEPSGGELVIQQTTTYELVDLAGTRGKIAVSLSANGKSKDGKLTIVTRSKGEVLFDLATPAGGSGRVETLTEIRLDAGAKVPLTQASTNISTFTSRAR